MLLSFIDLECFLWSTVSAQMSPMVHAGLVRGAAWGGLKPIVNGAAPGALCTVGQVWARSWGSTAYECISGLYFDRQHYPFMYLGLL